MLFGRRLKNSDAKQMLDHINYMQGKLEEEYENRNKLFASTSQALKDAAEKITEQEAEIQKLTDRIEALENTSETEE